jgi:hypothetical protein
MQKRTTVDECFKDNSCCVGCLCIDVLAIPTHAEVSVGLCMSCLVSMCRCLLFPILVVYWSCTPLSVCPHKLTEDKHKSTFLLFLACLRPEQPIFHQLSCLSIPSPISINVITATNKLAHKEWQQVATSNCLGHSA